MAFWRWQTMDTWSPFSFKFWRWGNLFGQSEFERITQLKKTLTQGLYRKVVLTTPLQPISALICPLTQKPIENPVLTSEGVIYEKFDLLKRIAAYNDVPGSYTKPSRDQIHDFPELKGVIQFARYRKTLFAEKKAEALRRAHEASHHQLLSFEYPAVFTCPLSKQLLKEPVITPEGRVYDREAIVGYLQHTQKNYDPLDGTPLQITSLVAFDELSPLLMLYRNRLAELTVNTKRVWGKTLTKLTQGLEAVSLLFSPSPSKEEQESISVERISLVAPK